MSLILHLKQTKSFNTFFPNSSFRLSVVFEAKKEGQVKRTDKRSRSLALLLIKSSVLMNTPNYPVIGLQLV